LPDGGDRLATGVENQSGGRVMSEHYFVLQNGKQLPAQYSLAEVRQLLVQHSGDDLLVWREGMAQWVAPSGLPEFAGASGAPPPAPQPSAGARQRSGGRGFAQAANSGVEAFVAADESRMLPHLGWLDTLIASIGRGISVARLDLIDDLARKIGHVFLPAAALMIFLYQIIEAGKTGARARDFLSALWVLPLAVVVQYIAVKFLSADRQLIDRSPNRLSSRAFLDSMALLLVIGILVAVVGGLATAINLRSATPALIGLGSAALYVYLLGATIHAECVNTTVGGEASAGQEALAIYAFFLKALLRLTPLAYGLASLAGTGLFAYLTIKLVFTDSDAVWTVGLFAGIATYALLGAALLPLLAYLCFVFSYLLIDFLQALLVVPGKLDGIASALERRDPPVGGNG